MGIFKKMHEKRSFDSRREHQELRRMLSEAISRGFVEEIPAMSDGKIWSGEQQWFRDKETGEIYRLVAPGERSLGWWARVDPEDLVLPGETVQ